MLSSNYIVRIYRFEEENPKSLVGVVEEVGVDGNRAFRDIEELWEILRSSISKEQEK
jgi:predicted transcriptional regulator YdeE